MEEKILSHEEWTAEGIRRFGNNPLDWKFKCPSCGYVASVRDWRDAGDTKGRQVAFSCIGRLTGSKKEVCDKTGGPCNYAGGGLLRLNPVRVKFEDNILDVFDFADQ